MTRVCVLTTSYPRPEQPVSGVFVADSVRELRARGVHVDVVSPQDFRHFGLAYGAGIPENLRARPWLATLIPAFLASFRRAAARVDADVVHAHWLAAGAVAATLRTPYVVQVWGTDLHLARRVPRLARPILARAHAVVSASRSLAEEARALGARDVRVIPFGVDLPDTVAEPDDPPHVLYAGRLAPEKGVVELAEAARGLPLVVVGDGNERHRFPDAKGLLPPAELAREYDRAAVVVVPSRREGYGVVAREAMAHGRAVVATDVGGLAEAIDDGVDGILVPPNDPRALRAALERVLADAELRRRLGAAARERARREFSHDAAATALIALYEETASPRRR